MADSADDEALRRRMAADVLEGSIAVTFRREPCFFDGTAVQGSDAEVIKCVDQRDGHIVGLGTRARLPAYINGKEQTLGYLCDLRADPTVRGGTLLARGYQKLKALHDASPINLYYTMILSGNETALSILTSKRASLPCYRPLGRVHTPAIYLDRSRAYSFSSSIRIQKASVGNIDRVIDYLNAEYRKKQLAPIYSSEDVGSPRLAGLALDDIYVATRDDKIIGTVACWDQARFRQIHVERYSARLRIARPFYNLLSSISSRKALPDKGDRIPFFYLAWTAIRDDDPAVFRELLAYVYADRRRGPWHFFIAGLHERHPLASQLLEYRHIASHGHLYAVHWDDGATAYRDLDARIPHVEVATL